MKRLFTKTFFELSHSDQAANVDSVLWDLERAAVWDDTGRIKAKIRRIEQKAVEYGIYRKDVETENP